MTVENHVMRAAAPLAICAILLAASGRLWMNLAAVTQPRDDLWDARTLVADALSNGSESFVEQLANQHGITSVSFQRYDSSAMVVIRPGADGQPGVAGVDDNGSGTIDDNGELGATGSDDICRVETNGDRREGSDASPSLTLQLGGVRPHKLGRAATSPRSLARRGQRPNRGRPLVLPDPIRH